MWGFQGKGGGQGWTDQAKARGVGYQPFWPETSQRPEWPEVGWRKANNDPRVPGLVCQ